MISQIKSLAKQTLIYGAGNILTRFVTFLLLPLFTNILTPEEFGLATLLFVFLGFMNIVYRYGLDSAFMRTFRDAKDAEDEKQFFSTAIWLSLGTGVLLSLIIFSFSENLASYLLQNSQYTNLLMIAAGILILDGLAHVPFALLRMKEKASLFISIKFINVVTTLGLNIYFLAILRMGVTGIFLSAFIAALVTDIFVFITAITQIRFRFSSTVAKDYLKFGLPFIPAGLASIVMEAIDRYIITYLKDTATVGIYSAGYKLGIFMLLITTAFNYAWQPFFLKIGKSEEARPLFARVFTYFTLVTLFVWVVLSAFIHEIIRVRIGGYSIIGSSFYESESIVPLILLAYVFQGAYLNFLPGIYFDKKTYYIPVITACGALVNVTLNFILIPLYGMMGAAIATLIGYGVMAIITLPISRRLFHVPYEWSKILKIAFCAAGAMAIIYLLGETIVIKLLGIAIFVAAIFILNIVPTNEMIKFTQSFRSSSSGNSKNDSHSQEN